MLLRGAMVWILPLFAARPLLGPIYTPLDHMVPPSFPLWLVVPAMGIDWVYARMDKNRGWLHDGLIALTLGLLFLALLLPVQWYFSRYMLTPAANNWLFAGDRYWSYNSFPGDRRFTFWGNENGLDADSLLWASLTAMGSAVVGMAWGHWMTLVKR